MHHDYWLGDFGWEYDCNKTPETWVHVSRKHQIAAQFWGYVFGCTSALISFTSIKESKEEHCHDNLDTVSIQ